MTRLMLARRLSGSLFVLAACAVVHAAACSSPTSVVLEISTDIPCGSVRGTSITVGTLGVLEAKPPDTVTPICGADGTIGSLVIVPSGEPTVDVAVKVVTGVDKGPEECASPEGDVGCIVARRALRYVEGRELHLPVRMADACKGKPCTPESTCVRGTCVSAIVRDSARCATVGACDEEALAAQRDDRDGGAPNDATTRDRDGGDRADGGGRDATVSDAEIDPTGLLPCTTTCGRSDVLACVSGVCTLTAKLVVAGSTSCVRFASGDVKCWGQNDQFQLALATSSPGSVTEPTSIPLLQGASTFRQNSLMGLGIFNEVARSWGPNGSGRLGRAPGATPYAPGDVQSLGRVREVAIGQELGCALDFDGAAVRCWGAPILGQLGRSPLPQGEQLTPQAVEGLAPPIAHLGVGEGFHACAIASNEELSCWGNNSNRQTSQTDAGIVLRAAPVVGPSGALKVAEVALGEFHTCARTTSGALYCWGSDDGGQAAEVVLPDIVVPRLFQAFDDARAVGVGSFHTCAIRRDRSLYCWGFNSAGQVGHSPVGQAATPKQIPLTEKVLAIGLGALHSCAFTVSGRLLCWGSNANGQLARATDAGLFEAPIEVDLSRP